MNNRLILLLLASIFFSTVLNSQNLLRQPESVTYDTLRNRYLVSNKQNGEIIAIDSLGNQSKFKTGLVSCRGLTVVNDTLYAATDLGVIGMELETSETVMNVSISNMGFLNDIAADTSNNLYISDSDMGKIYQVNIEDNSYSTLVSQGISGCNGLLFDERTNSLLVCLWPYPGTIRAIDLETKDITTLKQTNLDQCDGLAIDSVGNLYISSWGDGKVYMYDTTFVNEKVIISQNHSGPADIYINKEENILAVPNFNSNRVDFISLSGTSLIEEKYTPGKLALNYPNPFDWSTTIIYYVQNASRVVIEIYDSLGKHVKTLKDEFQQPGRQSVIWDRKDNFNHIVTSGVYFYKITTGKNSICKQVIVID